MLVLLLSAALANCASGKAQKKSVPPEQRVLNSDRIEQRFGSFGIQLLDSPATLRVANLYSADGAARVTRTLAVTRLENVTAHRAILLADREIRAGASIGITLRAHGWEVNKQHRMTDQLQLRPDVHRRAATLMRLQHAQPVAVHVYDLIAVREGQRLHYARIAEVHHPAYLSPTQLQDIFGTHAPGDAPARAQLLSWVEPALH